ncbi:armadillo repeat-containing protein 8-like isoform X2 [Halichondria panicea]|uniref:armadillo repeat-containing protein 8-like isoform X2 n=1 Tax=Halichondria panicea TaxID=6063 RepID=UPI00312B709D
MPSKVVGGSPQVLVDGLFSHDQAVRLECTRKIKNSIIGNKKRKNAFMMLGVIPRLVGLLEDDTSTVELVHEVVVTLGSFSHGLANNVSVILSTQALPLLINGLSHSNSSIVSACIRTLRTLYGSGLAPPSPLFDDVTVAKKLISLLSEVPAVSQSTAMIISKACQCPDHQNLLCSLGAITSLAHCLLSGAEKSVQCCLSCLSALVYENKHSSQLVATYCCDGQPLVSAISTVLTCNHGNETKLAAAQCLTNLCLAGSLLPDSPTITLRALPGLIRLCKKEFPLSLRTPAISALAYLTAPHPALQELCAESDRLIPTLVDYLTQSPDPEDEMVTEDHLVQFECLCGAVFQALSSLASSREEIRLKVASQHGCIRLVTQALREGPSHVRVAAGKCLHSLTRSTKLLRTTLSDCEMWQPCLEVLCLAEEELLVMATGVMCNLLLAFSPSREKLVEGGIIERLSVLSFHENSTIQLNAVWALMSATYDCNKEVRVRVTKSFGYQRIFQLCSPRLDTKLTMKALGILINIIHDSDDAESAVFNHGSGLLAAMVTLLTDNPSNEIREQVLCVLVNVCNLSVKGRDLLTGSEDIMRCISGLLHHNESNSVLLAACRVVKNLANSTLPDHVHRQNCLEEYGVKIALQKLERSDKLQTQVKEVLEHFMSHSL